MNKSTMTIVAALAAGAAAASTRTPYANDFTTRTSGATPSDRWMETSYIPGALARSVSSAGDAYNGASAYQDGWTMKAGYNRSGVFCFRSIFIHLFEILLCRRGDLLGSGICIYGKRF